MKRPTLFVCTRCRPDDARTDPIAFFAALKKARKQRGLKPLFKLKESGCQRGCDTPCNATLEGKKRPTVALTWLDAREDVEALLNAAKRYAKKGNPGRTPGRRG